MEIEDKTERKTAKPVAKDTVKDAVKISKPKAVISTEQATWEQIINSKKGLKPNGEKLG